MKRAIVFLILLFSLCFVSAFAYPAAFSGTAKYNNGTNIPNGYIITGEVNGVGTGTAIVSNGEYDLVVTDDIGDGGIVKFYINGEQADETANFVTFKVSELDLTIDSAPIEFVGCGDGTCSSDESCATCSADCQACPEYCGDGECNDGESCSSCSQDCGSCPATNSVSSGGGGGGGGSSKTSTNIVTTTTLTNNSKSTTSNTSSSNDENSAIKSIDELNQETEKSSRSGITGAVIGFAKTKFGIGLIFAGVIIVLGIIIIKIRKKV